MFERRGFVPRSVGAVADAAGEIPEREAAGLAAQYGLRVAAGHGLTYRNVGAVAGIPEITEFNIGHNIIARAIFVGLDGAVREMRKAIADGSLRNGARSDSI